MSNPIIAVQSMNSLQIAELVESRHDSVKRTIERLVEQEVIACPPMVDVQETKGNSRNYTTASYLFTGEQGKLDSVTVVAQLCPQFTARMVQRWQELEKLIAQTDYQALKIQNQTLKTHIIKQNPHYRTIKLMYDIGLDNPKIAGATGLSRSTIEKRLVTMRRLGLIAITRGTAQLHQPILEVSP